MASAPPTTTLRHMGSGQHPDRMGTGAVPPLSTRHSAGKGLHPPPHPPSWKLQGCPGGLCSGGLLPAPPPAQTWPS